MNRARIEITIGIFMVIGIACLAAHFEVPEDALREKIVQFREMGCTLFEPIEENPGT